MFVTLMINYLHESRIIDSSNCPWNDITVNLSFEIGIKKYKSPLGVRKRVPSLLVLEEKVRDKNYTFPGMLYV